MASLPLLSWLVASAAGCGSPASAAAPPDALASNELRAEPAPPDAGPPLWPAPGCLLSEAPLPKAAGRKIRIYVDPGHAQPKPSGNTSVFCEPEEDFSFRVGLDLAGRLADAGHFSVRLSRRFGEEKSYGARVAEADAFAADALIGLHSDARNSYRTWSPAPGQFCPRQDAYPGFSVLYSDEGTGPQVARRLALARAVAKRLSAAGFLAYDGYDYGGLYDEDPVPGVFVDRRQPLRTRVFMLRKPKVPSVIVETHHAWDFEEASRFREARTLSAFGNALANAVLDAEAERSTAVSARRP